MTGDNHEYQSRLRWFHEARFGMFIHFGLYSLLERGEWVMFRERIPPADYARLADRFNPQRFDARAWARLAVEAGMKYMVLTTRHHDGFCLFDSQVSDFTSTKTAARRDFVAEYVTAAREAGLKVGLYHSLLDWRFPGYFDPKRFPDSAASMVQQLHDQVRELLTNYGRIDVLWYDGDWICHGRIKDIPIAEFWRATELNAMARKLQPHLIINNRAGVPADIDTPEQHVTASQPGRAWESCMTIGHPAGWGYVRHAPDFKNVADLIQHLILAAAGEGNYLLNVGPQPDGAIRDEEASRLRAIGQWLAVHGEAIYGSQRCDLPDDRLPGGGNGLWTRRGNTAFLLVPRWPGRELRIPLVAFPPTRATIMSTGQRATIRMEESHRLVLGDLPADPPDRFVTGLRLEFPDLPRSMDEVDPTAWLAGRA